MQRSRSNSGEEGSESSPPQSE